MTERGSSETLPDREAQSGDIQPYDFTSPNRLSREQNRRIEYLHNSFVRRVSMSLDALVRSFVKVTVNSVEEANYSIFVDSIPSPSATFTFNAEQLEGVGLLDMDLKIAFALIDRVLGGKGEAISELRELTAIEQTVAAKIAVTILRELESAWAPLSELKMGIAGFANSPDFYQVYGGNTSIVVVTHNLETDSCEGTVSIAYPYPMFETVLRALAKTPALTKKKEPDKEAMAQIMQVVPIWVSARLPSSMVKMREIMNLEVGDVLILDSHVDEEVEVFAEGKRIFKAWPGRHKNRLAVKVSRTIRNGGSQK
jgi:flagellar motor switch protein FliM